MSKMPNSAEGSSTTKPEKRKADKLDGDTSDIPDGLRKTSISPAVAKSKSSAKELDAAQTRLAVAEKRKRELAEVFENMALAKKVGKSLNTKFNIV